MLLAKTKTVSQTGSSGMKRFTSERHHLTLSNAFLEVPMKRLSTALLFIATLFILPSIASAQERQCITNYGQTACGYHCVANYGQVKCANTPSGACKANYGQIFCTYFNARRAWNWPRASCLTNYGTGDCGYDCKANYGQVKCAKTPNGVCVANYGKVECYD
ncbi:MAG: hypothetical protein FWC40_00785 [Proteobacteria bacterium]|nr:hypothetical protein [Pseudomonadota bacterium]